MQKYCDNCGKAISEYQHKKGKGLCKDCIRVINQLIKKGQNNDSQRLDQTTGQLVITACIISNQELMQLL